MSQSGISSWKGPHNGNINFRKLAAARNGKFVARIITSFPGTVVVFVSKTKFLKIFKKEFYYEKHRSGLACIGEN